MRLTLRNAKTGERILPVYYDDNYFSLLPGESREFRIETPAVDGAAGRGNGESGSYFSCDHLLKAFDIRTDRGNPPCIKAFLDVGPFVPANLRNGKWNEMRFRWGGFGLGFNNLHGNEDETGSGFQFR